MKRAASFCWKASYLFWMFAALVPAQSLTPVTTSSSSPWLWVIVVAVVLVAIGVVVLKRKNPGAAQTVSADAAHVGTVIAAEAAKLRAALESKAPATEPSADPPAPVVDLQPELDKANGKLAQIKAVIDA